MSYTPIKIKKEGLPLTTEVVDIIVDGMTDHNKEVREAAYSTWVAIVELESDKVTDDMLHKITSALKTYRV
ncbi:MAG: hypothetical protein H7644_01040 [Candidatus Heimdallarchaeota archaeon]|nr:hypothetical protein [Candidatus Heimdallarchaeota archaeon]MCK5142334.1 hypothetical protein [Candidatus Heimdallarchaeota archaeon]